MKVIKEKLANKLYTSFGLQEQQMCKILVCFPPSFSSARCRTGKCTGRRPCWTVPADHLASVDLVEELGVPLSTKA